jgi:hypothetical protein
MFRHVVPHSVKRVLVPPIIVNPYPTNVIYMCRTAPLTSRHCILNIYSTNIRTEYFKHAA